jgi:N-acyl-phosphatidylethanolamine-hydrolysing phospholipase D
MRAWHFALLLAGATALACAGAGLADEMSMRGARRDQDGRFLNPAGALAFASPTVSLPFFLRRVGTTLTGRTGYPGSVANDGAFLRENAQHSVPSVTWIGHATVLVQMDHTTFLTDPIWSERASPLGFAGPKRAQAPGVTLDALPPIDFVLISHNHYDHLDAYSVETLPASVTWFVPMGLGDWVRKHGPQTVVELNWWQTAQHGRWQVTCVPSQHWSQRIEHSQNSTLWCAWVISSGERTYFFAGDTGYFHGFHFGAAAVHFSRVIFASARTPG